MEDINKNKADTRRSPPCLYARVYACSLLPLRAEHAEVALVAPLRILLSGGEELVGLLRELFSNRCKTHFALQVVLELIPLRLFGVELERVLTFCFEFRIIAPEVPSAALWAALPPLSRAPPRLSHPARLPRA